MPEFSAEHPPINKITHKINTVFAANRVFIIQHGHGVGFAAAALSDCCAAAEADEVRDVGIRKDLGSHYRIRPQALKRQEPSTGFP
jgi:hypothetical protein